MKGKTQSILLQVAFKEAAARGQDVAATKLLTSQFYVLLQELHTEIGINAEDGAQRGGGGGGGGGGFPSKPAFQAPADSIPFTLADGTTWIDYRPSKTSGSVKPKFPDFKTADGKESAYIYDQNGNPVANTVPIMAAADAIADLVAPM